MKREVIAFIGRQGSGKSYQALKLKSEREFKKISFADPLRDVAFSVLGMTLEEGMPNYDYLKKTELYNGQTFRNMLENLGASIRKYDKDFWARALVEVIKGCTDNIVIDDMRYPNEYTIVKTYCITQGMDFRAYFCDYKSNVYVSNNTHESAGLSNYLASLGYRDLQLVDSKDILGYSVVNDKEILTIDQIAKKTKLSIKQTGDQVIQAIRNIQAHR